MGNYNWIPKLQLCHAMIQHLDQELIRVNTWLPTKILPNY